MFASKEQVDLFKSATANWKRFGYPNADKRMPEIIDLFLKFDELTTVYCCEGHAPERENHGGRIDMFYIMFSATEKGFSQLQALYSKLAGELFSQINDGFSLPEPFDLRLSIAPRIHELADNDVHNAVVLSMDIFQENHKEVFFKYLRSSIEELLKELEQSDVV